MHTLWNPAADHAVCFTGNAAGLASTYDVQGFAEACVGAALSAVSAFAARRTGKAPQTFTVDRAHVSAAFVSERWLAPEGWALPGLWDPLSGDYPTADGWVRLHMNAPAHRAAALAALDLPADTGARDSVAAVVSGANGEAVEAAVVAAGGCAAVCRTAAAWAAHAQGRSVAQEPLCAFETVATLAPAPRFGVGPGLEGVRVLDLTRVIAGPVATRFLASHGADVLRVDPPGYAEVPALLPDTTWGKRRCALDLRASADRAAFEALVAGADALVHGYRRGALEALGYGPAALHALNPGLVVVGLNAYGATGPWAGRRGFDSLVQMSAGLADAGRAATGADRPAPLPAQALDQGTGYLAAAAVVHGLTLRLDGEVCHAHLSLARTALALAERGLGYPVHGPPLDAETVDRFRVRDESDFGPLRRVSAPGGTATALHPAGPLGMHPAKW